MKVIIVGGVAGGASCAARPRRLDEKVEILMVERAPGAINIPLQQLRTPLAELPRNREIHIFCRSGQRAYYATRILL